MGKLQLAKKQQSPILANIRGDAVIFAVRTMFLFYIQTWLWSGPVFVLIHQSHGDLFWCWCLWKYLTEKSKGPWRGSSCKGFKEAVATVETLPLRFWGQKSAGGSEHLPDGSFSSHWTGRVREQGGAGCGQAPLFWAGNCCSPSLHSKKLSYRDLKSLAHGHPTTNEREDSKKRSVFKIHSPNCRFVLDLKTNNKCIRR